MKRIGILGGTFDPVHNAHLALAHSALTEYQLDKVLFIPAGQPVRKLSTTHASATHRLHMLQLACEGHDGFCVSTLEVDKPQISYTVDTLRELKEHYGEQSELFLILGEDTALDLNTWKDSEEISCLAQVLYAIRPGDGFAKQPLPKGFTYLPLKMPASSLSSSFLRSLLEAGEDVSAFVPSAALSYIQKHGLYDKS